MRSAAAQAPSPLPSSASSEERSCSARNEPSWKSASSQRSSASPSSRSSSAAPSLPISTRAVSPRKTSSRVGSPGGCVAAIGSTRPHAERPPVEPLEEHRPGRDRPARREPERRDRVRDLTRSIGRLAAVGGHRQLELEHAHPVGLAAEALRPQARGVGPVRGELAVCRVPDAQPVSERRSSGPPRPRRAERSPRRRARPRTSSPRAARTPGRRRRRPSRSRRTPRRRRPRSGSRTVRKSACSDWACA